MNSLGSLVKFVFTLFIFAQCSLWWWQTEGTESRDWRHANVSVLGRACGEGQGQSKQDPRHWCLHTCWFKCRTNRFPPRPLLLYFQFTSIPQYNIYIHSSGYLQTVVQRVKKLFLKIFVFTVMSTKTQVLYCVTPCLLVIFIDVSATRLYLFTSRHGVIYQDTQIFCLTSSCFFFDVLLTVYLSIFISVINQLDAHHFTDLFVLLLLLQLLLLLLLLCVLIDLVLFFVFRKNEIS